MAKLPAMIGVVLCLATAAVPAAAKKKKKKSNPAALTLFRKAIQETNLEARNGKPFRLQAEVRAFGAGGKHADGMVIEFWAPGDKVRMETMFTGYILTEVRDDKKIWKKSNNKYEPYPVTVIWQALHFENELQLVVQRAVDAPSSKLTRKQQKEEKVDLGKPKKRNRGRWKCVRVRGKLILKERYCFDSTSGLPTEIRGTNGGMRYEFGDYLAFGTRSVPRSIRVFYSNGSQLADIQVDKIGPLTQPDPKPFLPPPGSTKVSLGPGCGNGKVTLGKVIAAKLIKRVLPIYPAKAVRERISGRVVLHVVIGKDGAPHALWVLKSPSPLLSEAALGAVRQWRYQVTLRCGKPVNVNTSITVIFTLR